MSGSTLSTGVMKRRAERLALFFKEWRLSRWSFLAGVKSHAGTSDVELINIAPLELREEAAQIHFLLLVRSDLLRT